MIQRRPALYDLPALKSLVEGPVGATAEGGFRAFSFRGNGFPDLDPTRKQCNSVSKAVLPFLIWWGWIL